MKHLNSLIAGMYKETSKGLTQNGAVTFVRSGSFLVDFFAQAGAMRNEPLKSLELFQKAYSENPVYAVRLLFYFRDVRGGQGERALFRTCLEWLGTEHQEHFERIVQFVPEYGRWDDVFFENDACFNLIKEQLIKDVESETPSLLAKWMPTINASSERTRAKAKTMATKLNLADYRKKIRDIRKKIQVVEEKMSAKKWGDINYEAVPSQAARIYKGAFLKHDKERYMDYVEKVLSGDAKINASTLYPYQIYNSVVNDYSKTLEALWQNLPDYTKGKNALVVADVSGSMSGDPMAVSVSLAMYFAERNVGQFNGYFLTFSRNPVLQKIVGSTLEEKMRNLERAQWDMNTDLSKVFDLILDTAVQNNTPIEEMPETIYIISDMEFDACASLTNYELIKRMYETNGYKIPNIVFLERQC
jgi:hypothetical protein